MAEENIRVDWRLLLVFLGLTAAALVIRTRFGGAPLINDTDDAMRLVEVRDLLAGQGWYDLAQHRLDAPYSTPMHWSRLIDLPIALLMLGLRPFLGNAIAETAAAYIYPLAMLAGLFWLSARVSLQLVGREGLLPGLALPAFSLVVFADFPPGRFDHHSAQILLLLLTLSLAIGALDRPSHALGAGVTTALALTIGVESLPAVLAAILAFGLAWVLDGKNATALRLFGLSFATASMLGLAATTDPLLWLAPACDAISIVYVVAAVGVGLVFAALSAPRFQAMSPIQRLLAGLAAGAALAAVLAILFPDCLRGPYAAIDPWLITNWLSRIEEAKPALAALLDNPAYVAAVTVPPLLAAAVAVERLIRTRGVERNRWVIYTVLLGLTLIVALIQIRGARMAMSLSVAAGAALIVAARAVYLRRSTPLTIAGLVFAWFGFAGLAIALATNPLAGRDAGDSAAATAPRPDEADCRRPEAFALLAAQPRQRIMAPIDLGAHLLAFTPHEVVAAPYHRDQRGVRDSFRFFSAPLAEARLILTQRGITEVVICAALPELAVTPATAADAFMPLLQAGQLPGWLVEISNPAAPLRVFSVQPGSEPQFRPELPGQLTGDEAVGLADVGFNQRLVE